MGVLLVPQTLVTLFCRQFDNNFDKLWRGYKTFRPQLTKYCRGCVPGIPSGVDAYVRHNSVEDDDDDDDQEDPEGSDLGDSK